LNVVTEALVTTVLDRLQKEIQKRCLFERRARGEEGGARGLQQNTKGQFLIIVWLA
jgi:hypothetical protein